MTTVSLPQLGESVSGGTIVAWLVDIGDEVALDQPIAEISTDKVDTEIPSPAAGTVTRLLVDLDTEVSVGEPILELDGGGTDAAGDGLPEAPAALGVPAASASPVACEPAAATSAPTPADGERRLSPRVRRLLDEHGLRPDDVAPSAEGGRITADDVLRAAARQRRAGRRSPLVKRLLREHGLHGADVPGTGSGGRVTPDDVRRAAASRPAPTTTAAAAAPAPPSRTDTPADRRAPAAGGRVEPLSRTRSVIAERMLASLQTTAQLTAAVEADVTRVMLARARHREAYRALHGGSLSPLAFITKALCRSLLRHPLLNASIDVDAGEVTYHGSVNLGVAVDAPEGLIVPNIPDAQELTVVALQRRITDLAERARNRRLRPDEIRGGTFTVTNTGSRGSLFDTPILNPPEVGILATPTIEKRPVIVEDEFGSDQMVVRHRTYLCLTYDHRLVDGADAARFLTDLAGDLDGTDWDQELAELL